jgi:hypothetical protein
VRTSLRQLRRYLRQRVGLLIRITNRAGQGLGPLMFSRLRQCLRHLRQRVGLLIRITNRAG